MSNGRSIRAALLLVLAMAPTVPAWSQAPEPFDLLIVGGRVLDGTGNPWIRADVGIRGDRIAAIGRLAGSPAHRVIDAAGKIVTPGFIDLHSHADDAFNAERGLRASDAARRAAPNLVSQGVTTVVVNQDGRSPWPIAEQRRTIEGLGVGPNVILLVGHGTVRRQVMGDDHRRAARADEITAMRALVRQAMAEGARGLSAGLEYVPGRWSTTDEVVALVEEIAPHKGVYVSHQRSEGGDPLWWTPSRDPAGAPTVLDAIRETIEIGERTGATVVASHVKAKGVGHWGVAPAIVRLIADARGRGVDVWADQYPYTTTGTDGNTVLLPAWALGRNGNDGSRSAGRERDYVTALRTVLADSAATLRLRGDVAHEIARRGGADNLVVFEYPDRAIVGKSVGELARARGIGPVDMAVALQLEGDARRPGGGRLRGFSLWEPDLDVLAAQQWTATASDAGIALPRDGSVHARYYGTFPRKLRHFALDRNVVSLEDAVRSMTSLPAAILSLEDRGLLRPGYHADLVVLDPRRVRDRATFFEPHQHAEGIELVLVNGRPVVDRGALTGTLPGKVLER